MNDFQSIKIVVIILCVLIICAFAAIIFIWLNAKKRLNQSKLEHLKVLIDLQPKKIPDIESAQKETYPDFIKFGGNDGDFQHDTSKALATSYLTATREGSVYSGIFYALKADHQFIAVNKPPRLFADIYFAAKVIAKDAILEVIAKEGEKRLAGDPSNQKDLTAARSLLNDLQDPCFEGVNPFNKHYKLLAELDIKFPNGNGASASGSNGGSSKKE